MNLKKNLKNTLPIRKKVNSNLLIYVLSICICILFISELTLKSLKIDAELREWIQYILMGGIYPLFCLAFLVIKRLSNPNILTKKIVTGISYVIAISGILFVVTAHILNPTIKNYFGATLEFVIVILCSTLHSILIFSLWKRNQPSENLVSLHDKFVLWALTTMLWSLGMRLMTHPYIPEIIDAEAAYPTIDRWLFPSLFNIPVALVRMIWLIVVVFGATYIYQKPNKEYSLNVFRISHNFSKILRIVFDVCVLFLFVFFAFEINPGLTLKFDYQMNREYFGLVSQMVRDGSWLYWDIPSAYGFLSILTIAAIPIQDGGIRLSFTMALLNLIGALIIYYAGQLGNKSWSNRIFTFAIVLATLFIRTRLNSGADYYYYYWLSHLMPQSSMIRILWPCILIFIVSLYYYNRITFNQFALLGNMAWIMGALWSGESLAFCAPTWLPAYSWFVILHHKNKWLSIARLFYPLLSLIMVMGLISTYYFFKIGEVPEWTALMEFTSTSGPGTGFGVPLPRDGPISITVALLTLTITTALNYYQNNSRHKAIGICLVCFGAVWGSTAYYVGHSPAAKFSTQLPVYAIAGLVLVNLLKNDVAMIASIVYRFLISNLLGFIVAVGLFADNAGIQQYLSSTATNLLQNNFFEPALHRVQSEDLDSINQVSELAKAIKVGKQDYVIIKDWTIINPYRYVHSIDPNENPMLYFYPNHFETVLPYGRAQNYLTRFLNRKQCSVFWIFEHLRFGETKSISSNEVSEWHLKMFSKFQQTSKIANTDWQITKYIPISHNSCFEK